MTDRPILFSAPMVRALLAGRKTQTRRILKPQPFHDARGLLWWHWSKNAGCACCEPVGAISEEWFKHLPWQVGDRLWVKETWCHTGEGVWSVRDSHNARGGKVIYRADDEGRDTGIRWFSPLFLPRFRSRLTLLVTDVRVERLKDISETDAQAEGVQPICDHGVGNQHLHSIAFEQLWCSLHGDGAWIANPWVGAVSFEVVERNIDDLPLPAHGAAA